MLDYDEGVRGPALTALLGIGMLACAADFQLIGRIEPEQSMIVFLQGATAPFNATTEADVDGHFRFRKLLAGTYVVMAGGIQRTVEVGPGFADSKRRVTVVINLTGDNIEQRSRVSVRELAVPLSAWHEYEEAEKALGRRDVAEAVKCLRRAVELAPRFSAAWNHLGTIAYQTGQYAEAESDFRKGLEADPDAYAPLVNLGGVLINLGEWDEALDCNRRAVLKKPQDALANSQLGVTYFYEGRLDLAEKYLMEAKQIDPSHFSHPQLILAEIHLRRNEPGDAVRELEDLLRLHPDLPEAAKIKAEIVRLRAGN